MFAVVVRESGDAERIDASGDLVKAAVVPRLREAPGFVSAVWTSDGAGGTLNVLTFESEATARAALEAARSAPRPPFMALDSVELVRVLATT
jgi:hypothetical protein